MKTSIPRRPLCAVTTSFFPRVYFKNGDRLDERSQYLLLRTLMVIGCEPGSVGQMSTGASPMDPIFWVLHPAFEKATHILYLSPRYRDTYDFSWVDADCDTSSGGLENDTYPFTGAML